MQPSKDLFRLIKSMNKAEKRHFKLIATQYATNSNYVKLFDAIDKQELYDESKLKRKFRNETFAKKLAATKYLLYELILKSLRGLYESKSIDGSLRAMIASVESLYQKGLYVQSRKLLNRASKMAHKYEKTFWAYEVLKWKKRLFSYIAPDKLSKALEELLQEDHKTTENLHNETTFVELFDKVKLFGISKLSIAEQQNRYQEILEHPLMQSEDRALTFLGKVHYYLIQSKIQYVFGAFEKAYDNLQKLVQLWHTHESYIPSYASLYAQSATEYLLLGFQIKSDFDYSNELQKLRKIPHVMQEQTAKHEVTLQILDFIACVSSNELLDCDCQVTHLTETLNRSGHLLDYNWLITAYYYIGIYYFIKAEHDRALEWLGKIDTQTKLPLCGNIPDFCQLLELIVHYELENYTFLEYRLRSVYRQLKQRKQVSNIELLLLKYIKKLIFAQNTTQTTGLFKQFEAQINIEQNIIHIPPMGSNVIQQWAKRYCS